MTPEQQMLFNIVVGVAGALGGWWLKAMWEGLKDLQSADRNIIDRLAAIEVLVAGTYIKRTDFEKVADAIFNKLDRIDQKLSEKVDK